MSDTTDTTAAFLDAWSATQQLWLASREGAMPHQMAGQLSAAHAAMDRAVSEAEKAGIVVVERDSGGRVTAIRAATADGTMNHHRANRRPNRRNL